MTDTLEESARDLLFRNARSENKWQDRPLPEGSLEQIWDLVKWGPTSMNGLPSRFWYCVSAESKKRLAACAIDKNKPKITSAPACCIIATEMKFYKLLDRLSPDMAWAIEMFDNNTALAEETAFRNGTLQGAYFMIAARALGLDCGAMSGFDNAAVDREFFAGTTLKSNFICSIGYGDPDGLEPRLPRLDFGEACKVL